MTSVQHTTETEFSKWRRTEFKPQVPTCLQDLNQIVFENGEKTQSLGHTDKISTLFANTYGQPVVNILNQMDTAQENNINQSKQIDIGVMFAGGPAAGGHNVITGLFDALKELNINNRLFGFMGGPSSIVDNKYCELTSDIIDKYRNTGGFDLIGSGRHSTDPKVHFPIIFENIVYKDKLDGLIIIGGDGTNTLTSLMAEYFANRFKSLSNVLDTLHIKKCTIIGVPKTIDGDLQNKYIEISFGFDTAVKIYSHLISNICKTISNKNRWHFVKLMGRAASQVTLECSLLCHPNVTLICEDVESESRLLDDICERITSIIVQRSEKHGKNYGIILIPEGIISFIPSMRQLINDLNYMMATEESLIRTKNLDAKIKVVQRYFKSKGKQTQLRNFNALPRSIKKTLLLERDASGRIQMSLIPTEKLFMHVISKKLESRRKRGKYHGKFSPIGHFFGYEGRCGWPTNFDCNYCYNLGRVSALLVNEGYNGYMTRVYDLEKHPISWKAGGIPITMLLNMKHNYDNPNDSKDDDMRKIEIKKALVDLYGKKYQYFLRTSRKQNWAINDCYRDVGPIQYNGPSLLITDMPPLTVLFKKTSDITWNPTVDTKDKDSECVTCSVSGDSSSKSFEIIESIDTSQTRINTKDIRLDSEIDNSKKNQSYDDSNEHDEMKNVICTVNSITLKNM